MASLPKLTSNHQPLLISPLKPHKYHSFHHPSSIPSKTHFTNPTISFKIHPSSSLTNTHLEDSNFTRPHIKKSLLSILKTPFCIAVAATALFLSGFASRPLLAIAAAPPPSVESREGAVSDEEKEKTLEERVASNPDDVEALKSLMEVKIKSKKLLESIEVINKLIEVEPDEFEWKLLRSHMYSYIGESEIAKAGFEEILAKDPLRVEAFHGLVMAISQGDETDSKELNDVTKRVLNAIEKCKKDKKKDDERDFRLLIAQIRVIQGNYNEALKVYQELVKEEPRDFRPYLCQGIIYTLLRKKDEANKQFETYKRLVPKGHPYAEYFDDNMLATKVFSQMAEGDKANVGSRGYE